MTARASAMLVALLISLTGCKPDSPAPDGSDRAVVGGRCSSPGAVGHSESGARVTCRRVDGELRWG